MSRTIDPDVLVGFVAEVRGYLPRILGCIEEIERGTSSEEAVETAHRLVHSIKGAASMVGLSALSHLAYGAEQKLERLDPHRRLPAPQGEVSFLRGTMNLIERYLEGAVAGDLEQSVIFEEAIALYRSLGDSAAERLRALVPRSDIEAEPLEDVEAAPSFVPSSAPPSSVPPSSGPADSSPTPQAVVEEISQSSVDAPADDLVSSFWSEAEAHLDHVQNGVGALDRDPANLEAFEQVRTSVQMLQGAATMVGLPTLGRLAREMVEALELHPIGQALSPLLRGSLLQTIDTVRSARVDRVPAKSSPPISEASDSPEVTDSVIASSGGVDAATTGLAVSGPAIEEPPVPPVVSDLADAAVEDVALNESSEGAEEASAAEASAEEASVEETSAEKAEKSQESSASLPTDEVHATNQPVNDQSFLEEDVSDELVDAFRHEAEDHLQIIHSGLRALQRVPTAEAALHEVRRSVHTLKGAAAMVGFPEIGQLAHRMEDLLDACGESGQPLTSSDLDLLFATADALSDLASAEVGSQPTAIDELFARYDALFGKTEGGAAASQVQSRPPVVDEELVQRAPELDRESGVGPQRPATDLTTRPGVDRQSTGGEGLPPVAEHSTERAEEHPEAPASARSEQILRLPIGRVDELVRLVSELVVNRSTFEQHYARFLREVAELRLSTERLHRLAGRLESGYESFGLTGIARGDGQATSVSNYGLVAGTKGAEGFDELEFDRYTELHLLSRELSESASDLGALGDDLSNTGDDFDLYRGTLGRLTADVQDRLMRLRMVPFHSLASRLHRTVRVTAGQQGKAADLVIEAQGVELDKTMLEEMADPLIHLLRNAVGHGIEQPSVRTAGGKPERGQITVRAAYEGTHVVIRLTDDGGGLNLARLRAGAVAAGYVSQEESTALSEERLFPLIFRRGFSTAAEVSEISGRGVGLDVVKTSVQRLKGLVSVESASGKGSTFTIRLPMTLAITRVLMVEASGQRFAIPQATVQQILRLEHERLQNLATDPVVRIDDALLPVVKLNEALDLGGRSDEVRERLPVLVLAMGDQRVALLVDEILEAREVVVKSMGSLLRQLPGFSGATLMGDGSVVLILDPTELVNPGFAAEPEATIGDVQADSLQRAATTDVMIVDDSVSVRKVLTNLIRNRGWNPITARDGLEALEIIQRSQVLPQVVLLDIEMPRMDGYELTSTLRGLPQYRDLPIVMLTSRAGERHRQRAFELGATEYMVKPYRDDELIGTIRRLIRETELAVN